MHTSPATALPSLNAGTEHSEILSPKGLQGIARDFSNLTHSLHLVSEQDEEQRTCKHIYTQAHRNTCSHAHAITHDTYMYTHLYTYMYTYVHTLAHIRSYMTHLHVYTHAHHTHTCTHIYTCMYTHVHTLAHTRSYMTHLHVYTHAHHTHIHTLAHTHVTRDIHTYIHTHVHTHLHIYTTRMSSHDGGGVMRTNGKITSISEEMRKGRQDGTRLG